MQTVMQTMMQTVMQKVVRSKGIVQKNKGIDCVG